MGSSLSKSKKKNRQSAPAGAHSSKSGSNKGRPRPASQGPPPLKNQQQQWPQQDPDYQEDADHYSPMNNYDYRNIHPKNESRPPPSNKPKSKGPKESKRNSGNNHQHSNTAQPRTSTSNGRPSFSLLRGRKSTNIQRQDEPHILHISSPIIEAPPPSGANTHPDKGYKSRQSMDTNRHYQPYVEPPRSTSGAYKAPVPALPISAPFASSLPLPDTSNLLPFSPSELSSFPPPPNSIAPSSPHQEPQRLWRESLRNAAEGRKADSVSVVRSNSNRSHVSESSSSPRTSVSSSRGGVRKNKPLSGSTFGTLSPSSSNASTSTFAVHRQRTGKDSTNNYLESSLESRSARQRQFLQQLDRLDNASNLSLPGSRFQGTDEDGSFPGSSVMASRNGSEISLGGSGVAGTGAAASPSLVGVNTLNDRLDNQFSSPRHSQQSQLQHQLQQPHLSGFYSDIDSAPSSPVRRRRTLKTTSSARESVSSISTANYQWMEEQAEALESQDVAHRDSVMMLFNNIGNDDGSISSSSVPPSPERPSVPRQEQQQHALLKYLLKGNYRAPLNKDDLGSILDVGCGTGLWMKDMATEFPLTEVHGVDSIIPTRRRRTRAPAAASTTAQNASPSPTAAVATKKNEQHSSYQSNASSVNSSSSNTPAPSPVMMDTIPSNCFFHKADFTRRLPFEDNTFDYCHVRLVLWGYPLNRFPDLLNELVRVTKKEGWIEFADMDPCVKKANETGERINEWIKTGLIHSNMDPVLVKSMPTFLKEYCDATSPDRLLSLDNETYMPRSGLGHLKVSKISLPFGPWGGQVGELWQQNFTAFLKELEPMMVDATLSGLVMDQYHRQCQQEMLMEVSEDSEFDQRLCTHRAWNHLIQQLTKDANRTVVGPPSPSMASSFASSIKEMRSYNNFYLIYAQKVDLVELRQQLMFQQLEQEILSPGPKAVPATSFSLDSVGTEGHAADINGSARDEEAAPTRVMSLTEDALEALNKNQQGPQEGQNPDQTSSSVNAVVTSPILSAPRTPASVAALLIRSNSRSSNLSNHPAHDLPAVGTPGSITNSSVCGSPLAEMAARRVISLGRQGSLSKNGFTPPAVEEESATGAANKAFVPDYFNQVPSAQPTTYHQQQFHHHQQKMNEVRRKPHILSTGSTVQEREQELEKGQGQAQEHGLADSSKGLKSEIEQPMQPLDGQDKAEELLDVVAADSVPENEEVEAEHPVESTTLIPIEDDDDNNNVEEEGDILIAFSRDDLDDDDDEIERGKVVVEEETEEMMKVKGKDDAGEVELAMLTIDADDQAEDEDEDGDDMVTFVMGTRRNEDPNLDIPDRQQEEDEEEAVVEEEDQAEQEEDGNDDDDDDAEGHHDHHSRDDLEVERMIHTDLNGSESRTESEPTPSSTSASPSSLKKQKSKRRKSKSKRGKGKF